MLCSRYISLTRFQNLLHIRSFVALPEMSVLPVLPVLPKMRQVWLGLPYLLQVW